LNPKSFLAFLLLERPCGAYQDHCTACYHTSGVLRPRLVRPDINGPVCPGHGFGDLPAQYRVSDKRCQKKNRSTDYQSHCNPGFHIISA